MDNLQRLRGCPRQAPARSLLCGDTAIRLYGYTANSLDVFFITCRYLLFFDLCILLLSHIAAVYPVGSKAFHQRITGERYPRLKIAYLLSKCRLRPCVAYICPLYGRWTYVYRSISTQQKKYIVFRIAFRILIQYGYTISKI